MVLPRDASGRRRDPGRASCWTTPTRRSAWRRCWRWPRCRPSDAVGRRRMADRSAPARSTATAGSPTPRPRPRRTHDRRSCRRSPAAKVDRRPEPEAARRSSRRVAEHYARGRRRSTSLGDAARQLARGRPAGPPRPIVAGLARGWPRDKAAEARRRRREGDRRTCCRSSRRRRAASSLGLASRWGVQGRSRGYAAEIAQDAPRRRRRRGEAPRPRASTPPGSSSSSARPTRRRRASCSP